MLSILWIWFVYRLFVVKFELVQPSTDMMHLTGKTIEYQSLDHLHQHGTCTFFFFSSVLTEPELQTFCKNCVCKLDFTKKRRILSYFCTYKPTNFLQRGKLCQPQPLTDDAQKAVSVRPRPRRQVLDASFPVPPVMSPGSRQAQRHLPAANVWYGQYSFQEFRGLPRRPAEGFFCLVLRQGFGRHAGPGFQVSRP